jgi:hypothetical protein
VVGSLDARDSPYGPLVEADTNSGVVPTWKLWLSSRKYLASRTPKQRTKSDTLQ